MIRFLLIAAAIMLLAGCAKTTVVLLPDADGKVGKVDVSTDAGTKTLDQENEYTEVSSKGSMPKEPETMKQEQMQSTFKTAMAVLPDKPVSFLLYFTAGTSDLTEESVKVIPDVVDSVRKREPSEVSIIGHSDTMGAADFNIKLSLERANSIKNMLIDKGVNMSKIEVRSHGEKDPVIKTGDGVPEPRNRRVEIMVR